MSTLQNRPNTALVVIDVQNGVVAEAHNREVVIGRVSALVDRARAESIPVVWVQHNGDDMPVGSKEWDYVSELELNESEPVIHKSYGDSFEGTNFEQVLSELGIGHVVVAGAETDACIRSTIHGAFTRGYDVTLVAEQALPRQKTSPSPSGPPPSCQEAGGPRDWVSHGSATPQPRPLHGDGLLGVRSDNLDLAGLGPFTDRDQQGKHAVLIGCRDRLSVDAVAKGELAIVAASAAFLGDPLGSLVHGLGALGTNGQQIAIQVDVDRSGIHAREVGVEQVPVSIPDEVHRYGAGARPEHVPEAIEVAERIKCHRVHGQISFQNASPS